MRSPTLVLLLFVWLAPSPGRGHAVEMAAVWHGGAEASPSRLLVKAIPAEDEAVEIEVELGPTLAGRLDLAPGIWRFEARGENLWIPPKTLFVGDGGSRVALEVYPTGVIRGRLELVERNAVRPEFVSLRFRGSPRGEAAVEGGEASESGEPQIEDSVVCPVGEEGWSCRVPVGVHDLRVRATGFISHFFWGEKVGPAKPLDLGNLKLRRGASVVGFVVSEDGAMLPENLEIELVPRAAGAVAPDEARRLVSLAASAPIGERGFFHVRGVAPGSYEARVEAAGWVPLRTTPIQVVENSETELEEPLVLGRPLKLSVTVEPPLDRRGDRWRFLLIDRASSEPVAKGVADESGRFVFDELRPGELLLDVSDGYRDVVATDVLWLEPPGLEHRVLLDMVEVEGRLRLGEEPIACGVSFRAINGGVKVAMESDEDGLFDGVLPRSGDWSIDVRCEEPPVFRRLWSVTVEPRANGGPAWVELDLPDTWLEGEVVDSNGEPVSGAGVLAIQETVEERPFFTRTDEEGAFRFRGVAKGRYHLQARVEAGQGNALESERALVEADEDQPQSFHRLTLLGRKFLRGTVTSSAGPVAVAEITARPQDAQALFVPKSRTEIDGSYELSLPDGTRLVELTIMAPGFALYRQAIDLGGRETFDVALSQAGGGELVLTGISMSPGASYIGEARTTVRHGDGARFDLSTLGRWADVNGQRTMPDRLVVPHMPAGNYEVCSTSRSREDAKPARCSNGFLAPRGRLELNLESSVDEEPSR